MDQKTFVALFIIVTVIAVIGLAANKFQSSSGASLASPSPTAVDSAGLLFNTPTAPANALQAQPVQQNQQQPQGPTILSPAQLQNKKVVIQTKKGTIEFALDPEASMAASNFIFLATHNFYNGLTFHRVVPGFVVRVETPKVMGQVGRVTLLRMS